MSPNPRYSYVVEFTNVRFFLLADFRFAPFLGAFTRLPSFHTQLSLRS
jgi:hypothetical protein